MINKQFKAETAGMIDIMIQHTDKGPSGFWTEDYEGCGNAEIFPEFNEGLKHGKLIQKNHYLCPWNTAVFYGDGHGNITTGCYHSCSINDARYLSAEMLKTVLLRFKKKMQSGYYDNAEHIEPLLSKEEQSHIINQKKAERKEQERQAQIQHENKIEISKELVGKFKDNKDIQDYIIENYGENHILMSEFGGIDFSQNRMGDIVGGEKLTYDDYLEIQFKSSGKYRKDFANCFYNIPMGFMGQIEKLSKDTICFKRIFVSGMFPDGEMFDGKEDHVWMDKTGFESFVVGDSVSFSAEVYRYIKTGNGKTLDYSLRNPANIKKIDSYNLPTDEELMRQQIDWIICETCYLNEQCSRMNCMMNPKEKKRLKKQMLEAVKNDGGQK